jgi:hypothetical protein
VVTTRYGILPRAPFCIFLVQKTAGIYPYPWFEGVYFMSAALEDLKNIFR